MTALRLALDIHDTHVVLDVIGERAVAERWAEYTGATPCLDAHWQRAELRLEVTLLPGWLNESTENHVFVDEHGALRIERPLVSGALLRYADHLGGRFTANGDGTTPLDALVSLGLSMACDPERELMLHASAVARDGRAHLFLGVGGAGKTTIAVELNDRGTTMSVDRTLVTSAPGEIAVACSTPLGDTERKTNATGCLPVAGLFFIAQAPRHTLTRLSSWEAMQGLLTSALRFQRDIPTTQHLLALIGRIAEHERCYRLEFARDAGFWPAIDKALNEDSDP